MERTRVQVDYRDTIQVFLRRRRLHIPVHDTLNMHRFHYLSWVKNIWIFVDEKELNPQVVYTCLRTFVLFLAACPPTTTWNELKWERYACFWIALKVDDVMSPLTTCVDDFLDMMFEPLPTTPHQRQLLLHAEHAVLSKTNFDITSPNVFAFLTLLVDMYVSCIPITVLETLRSASYCVDVITLDPAVVTAAVVHRDHPDVTPTLTELFAITAESVHDTCTQLFRAEETLSQ
jgi:hypothetical protein